MNKKGRFVNAEEITRLTMPIVGYPGWPPVIDANTGEHVRFTMSDGRRVLPCRISVSALRDYFGSEDVNPIDIFLDFQTEIESAASKKYDLNGMRNGYIELKEVDFD